MKLIKPADFTKKIYIIPNKSNSVLYIDHYYCEILNKIRNIHVDIVESITNIRYVYMKSRW